MELASSPRYLVVQSLHAPGTMSFLYTHTPPLSSSQKITLLRVRFGLIDKWLRKLTHHNRHQGPKPWLCHTLRTTSSLLNQGNSFQGATHLSRPIFSASKRFQVGDIGDIPPLHPLPGILTQPSGPKQAAQPARAWLSGDVRWGQVALEVDLTNCDYLCKW